MLNLLLLALTMCVGAAFYGSKQEVKQIQQALDVQRQKGLDQEATIKKLRAKLGILDVNDESKIHIQARHDPLSPSADTLVWRWRIHLPPLQPGERWGFRYRTGKVSEDESELESKNSGGWGTAKSGQFDLSIALERNIDGVPRIQFDATGDRGGMGGMVRLSEAEVVSLGKRARSGSTVICGKKLMVAPADKQLEILRIPSGDKPGEEIGVVVFLQKNPAKRHPGTGATIP